MLPSPSHARSQNVSEESPRFLSMSPGAPLRPGTTCWRVACWAPFLGHPQEGDRQLSRPHLPSPAPLKHPRQRADLAPSLCRRTTQWHHGPCWQAVQVQASGRQRRVWGHLSLIVLHLAPGDTPSVRCSRRRHLLSRVFTTVTKATFVTRAQDDGDQECGTEHLWPTHLSVMSPLVMRITKKNELEIKNE